MTGQFQPATLKTFGASPFFIFCDHASNDIPAPFDALGLPQEILKTHIAWDIGAAALSTTLAERLNGAAFLCTSSRLLIDVNRSPDANDAIPSQSDQTPIPGNVNLSANHRADRFAIYHEAYHAMLEGALTSLQERISVQPFVVSVHSFTKRMSGAAADRPWPISLLSRHDRPSTVRAIDLLSAATGWPIGDNEPYSAHEFNYTIDRNVAPRGFKHLTFEIRQDMIGDDAGVSDIADILTPVIAEVAAVKATV
ncbi:MAG: N-formylglutamate amidohydrolase [Pseudomonadota bacterium]